MVRYLVVEVNGSAYSLGDFEFIGEVSYEAFIRRLETALGLGRYDLGARQGRFDEDVEVWESVVYRSDTGTLSDISWFYVYLIDGVIYRKVADCMEVYDGVYEDELEFY